MLVTDVVNGKYIVSKKKTATCLSEKKKKKSILAAQAFSFRGDKYIMKKVRAVSHACDTPTGPYLCLYQLEQCFRRKTLCPFTSLNRHIVKIDCIYNKLKVTIYLYVSLVKIHPFLNEIGC